MFNILELKVAHLIRNLEKEKADSGGCLRFFVAVSFFWLTFNMFNLHTESGQRNMYKYSIVIVVIELNMILTEVYSFTQRKCANPDGFCYFYFLGTHSLLWETSNIRHSIQPNKQTKHFTVVEFKDIIQINQFIVRFCCCAAHTFSQSQLQWI